jgi:anti-sigma B factor antagonist
MLTRSDNTESSTTGAMPFAVSRRDLDAQTSIVAVRGELDLTSAPELKWTLVDSLEAGHSQLVVDLSETTFMDSTALGVLVGVNRTLGSGGRLAIVCAGSALLKIFELSGMDGVFHIFATVDDALVRDAERAAQAG